jgi:hypothetical protein
MTCSRAPVRRSRAFEGEEFEARRQQALAEVQRRQEQIAEEIQRAARERGFQIQQTPAGIVPVPVRDGQPLAGEARQRLAGGARRAATPRERAGRARGRLHAAAAQPGARRPASASVR